MASRAARRIVSAPSSLAIVGERVSSRIDALLAAERDRWWRVDDDLEHPFAMLRRFVARGGKRLRPTFCYWAFVGAGGDREDPMIIDAGAGLELLHTFALLHDDVMDGSDLRRGEPAMHKAFASEHESGAWRGDAGRFGDGAAILVGDLAFVYADLMTRAIPAGARPVFDEARVELCAGQYLDLIGMMRSERDADRAAKIARYKSGKYTVERPLHFGAALAGHLDEFEKELSAVGLPLGDAFQLRDDVLGVFGEPEATGKPVGDDLRQGKLTQLLAAAVIRLGDEGALARVGARDLTEDEVQAIQDAIAASGALAEIEDLIERRLDEALAAIETLPFGHEAKDALRDVALYVAWRVN